MDIFLASVPGIIGLLLGGELGRVEGDVLHGIE
jgi:hypothetical protein